MRAATYARVSTQEQADTGTSLDTQRDRTRAYVDAQGWELVAEYVDEGVSGAADRRPDLDRLALIIHGTSGWLVSMDGLGCGVALAG